MTPSDKSRGLYRKFNVERTDGTSAQGAKHHGCEYFVLDTTHDKFAAAALAAYANACEREYPLLAADLRSRYALPASPPDPLGEALNSGDGVYRP
jgi:hypothetical protein